MIVINFGKIQISAKNCCTLRLYYFTKNYGLVKAFPKYNAIYTMLRLRTQHMSIIIRSYLSTL